MSYHMAEVLMMRRIRLRMRERVVRCGREMASISFLYSLNTVQMSRSLSLGHTGPVVVLHRPHQHMEENKIMEAKSR